MPNMLLVIVQIAIILITARLVGLLFRRIHQPQVIGEMAAGILLGPSLLGWVAPGVSAALFPADSLGFLSMLSQVGLVIFMFLVGLELNPRLLRGRGKASLTISWVSIATPFALGSVLAWYLYSRLAPPDTAFLGFALFMGVAMSVTAFPVLARILTERNLLRTPVGSMAITCAAIDDVSAWCLLAAVVLIVRAPNSTLPLWATVGGAAAFAGIMLLVVRPLVRRFELLHAQRGRLTQDLLAGVLLVALASAWMTEWLGLHALFGAFLAGAVLPKGERFVRDLVDKLEDVTVVLLLPIYFAFTGLRMSVGLLGPELWGYCALIVLVAVAGKFGGATLTARALGQSWRAASAIGLLMNTRGLVELVVLNIGLDIGVLSPTLFTMLVLMALGTTFLTSPLLAYVYPQHLFWREQLEVDGLTQAFAATG